MKKAVYFTLGLILLSVITNAKGSDPELKPRTMHYEYSPKPTFKSGKCFDENSKVLNFGIGFGYSYHQFPSDFVSNSYYIPAISVSYEQPWSKRFGPGLMGIGGYFGYKASGYKYEFNDPVFGYVSKNRYSDMVVASRAMYHWDGLNSEKAEVYGGLILGLVLGTSNSSTEYTGQNAGNPGYMNSDSHGFSLDLAFSLVAGARYYFKPNLAVYSELSYGISFITFGLSLKI